MRLVLLTLAQAIAAPGLVSNVKHSHSGATTIQTGC
jgi:hypothetical protein